jgi:hypothetical protein
MVAMGDLLSLPHGQDPHGDAGRRGLQRGRLGRREADIKNRFVLPANLTLKNFGGLDLGKMDQDSGPGSYVFLLRQR